MCILEIVQRVSITCPYFLLSRCFSQCFASITVLRQDSSLVPFTVIMYVYSIKKCNLTKVWNFLVHYVYFLSFPSIHWSHNIIIITIFFLFCYFVNLMYNCVTYTGTFLKNTNIPFRVPGTPKTFWDFNTSNLFSF